jgi:hypothetical protein
VDKRKIGTVVSAAIIVGLAGCASEPKPVVSYYNDLKPTQFVSAPGASQFTSSTSTSIAQTTKTPDQLRAEGFVELGVLTVQEQKFDVMPDWALRRFESSAKGHGADLYFVEQRRPFFATFSSNTLGDCRNRYSHSTSYTSAGTRYTTDQYRYGCSGGQNDSKQVPAEEIRGKLWKRAVSK